MLKDKSLIWLVRLTLLLLLFLSLYTFMKLSPIMYPIFELLLSLFIPFFISGFITYLLHPIVEKLHGRGIPRPIAILFIYSLFFGGIGYSIYKGLPLIIHQLRDLAENIPNFLNMYRGWISELYIQTAHLPTGFQQRINDMLLGVEKFADDQITHALSILKGLLNSIILLAIIPFIVFYLLKDFELVKKAVWYMTPRKWRERGKHLLQDIDESLGNYIRGQLIVCLFIGIVATFAFWVAGMSYPLLLGIIVGITNVIPYFGPIIGAVPAVIIAATISVKMIFIVSLIILGLQLIEGNILSPLIVGKSLHMHPVFIIFALLLGEEIGGIIGLILAVPLMAVLKVILLHVKEHFSKH